MPKAFMVLALGALAAGCVASRPADIQGTYVSATKYAGFSCDQIRAEVANIDPRLQAQIDAQQKRRGADIVSGVFFGITPSMFGSNGLEADIAVLKGERRALGSENVKKGCPDLPWEPVPTKSTELPTTSSD